MILVNIYCLSKILHQMSQLPHVPQESMWQPEQDPPPDVPVTTCATGEHVTARARSSTRCPNFAICHKRACDSQSKILHQMYQLPHVPQESMWQPEQDPPPDVPVTICATREHVTARARSSTRCTCYHMCHKRACDSQSKILHQMSQLCHLPQESIWQLEQDPPPDVSVSPFATREHLTARARFYTRCPSYAMCHNRAYDSWSKTLHQMSQLPHVPPESM